MVSKTRNLIVAVALVIAGPALAADQATTRAEGPVAKINAEAASAEITTQALRGNISVLAGSGGNIAVLASDDGMLMVDAGISVSQPRVSAALDRIGATPVKYLVNTHWHWDHTDGNAWVQERGAAIIAHENTLKHLSETTRVDEWNHTFPPLPASALPTLLVDTTKTLDFGGEKVVIGSYGPSHTDGDLYVHFAKADVLVTGDTFWNGVYPFIDANNGGSIDGMIRAANINVAVATDDTVVVSGHGPVGDRSQLIEYRDMLVAIRQKVASLKKQGLSLEEVVSAKPTAAYDARWGHFVIDPAFFTRLVHNGL